jgi:hypothetical protein
MKRYSAPAPVDGVMSGFGYISRKHFYGFAYKQILDKGYRSLSNEVNVVHIGFECWRLLIDRRREMGMGGRQENIS